MVNKGTRVLTAGIIILSFTQVQSGILYPRVSETRQLLSLDGLWSFVLTNISDATKEWFLKDFKSADDLLVEFMPVPASYNDLGTQSSLRDHVGLVWYQRKFFVPKSWNKQNVWVRFSSVCYAAEVWVNGEWVTSHTIGHLPFQGDVTDLLNFGQDNIITVAVDNILTQSTVPQGSLIQLSSGRIRQNYTFDFFNYAGIDRPVVLYTTPTTFIDDITVFTDTDGSNGYISYSVTVEGDEIVVPQVILFDKNGVEVASDTLLEGMLSIPNANFWWPYLMDPNPGYLYTLQIQLLDSSGTIIDQYSQPVGIRSITWDSKSLKINDRPVYLRGFGRHEDSDIRGKGFDLPVIIRDHNLIKWIGANSYRTSHYPYAEEIMDLADELGIMIIDECPSVHTENYNQELLINHKQAITEMIKRDKNRPSVIMWSAANEPRTQYEESEDYYRQIIAHVKSLDRSRPVTIVNSQLPDVEYAEQFVDIITCNIYQGWYSDTGDLDTIIADVTTIVRRWNEKHNMPVIMTEYGADTLEGLHLLPAYVWSEEFQNAFLSKYFEAFDQMREEGFFIGEMIWNFADFQTDQAFRRVGGNRKGVFTRNREPKASAHLLRRRYWTLAEYLDNVAPPEDLDNYIYEKIKRYEL